MLEDTSWLAEGQGMTGSEGNRDGKERRGRHRNIGGYGQGCRDRCGQVGHSLTDLKLMADGMVKVMKGMGCH